MYNDSLFRVSLKCIIKNNADEVLVVKEAGRSTWDLPGGGMDHGESIVAAVARELKEEVGFEGTFTYRVVSLDEPVNLLTRDVWQIRVILAVETDSMKFSVGDDADEIQFIDPAAFIESEHATERKIHAYAQMALQSTLTASHVS